MIELPSPDKTQASEKGITTYQHFIDGKWVSARSGAVLPPLDRGGEPRTTPWSKSVVQTVSVSRT